MNKLENFLLDRTINDQVFDNKISGKIKLHKEPFDERFDVLYLKHYDDSLSQRDYNVSGYIDIIDKKIYDCDFWISEIIPKESSISLSSFSSLTSQMLKEIEKYIEDYSFKNQKDLKSISKKEFNSLEEWRINNFQKTVREQFIQEDDLEIVLGKSYSEAMLTETKEYHGKNVLIDYLNNPQKVVEKYSKKIISQNKEKLGLDLLIYDYKNDFLNKIEQNKKHVFDELYINKKIYSSIKDIDAKTLNITINYNDKTMTFKYDYNTLKYDLINDNRSSGGYGVAYEKVSEFIKENNPDAENHRWKEEFLFSHVSSITYGKKELYKNESLVKEQEVDLEEEIEK